MNYEEIKNERINYFFKFYNLKMSSSSSASTQDTTINIIIISPDLKLREFQVDTLPPLQTVNETVGERLGQQSLHGITMILIEWKNKYYNIIGFQWSMLGNILWHKKPTPPKQLVLILTNRETQDHFQVSPLKKQTTSFLTKGKGLISGFTRNTLGWGAPISYASGTTQGGGGGGRQDGQRHQAARGGGHDVQGHQADDQFEVVDQTVGPYQPPPPHSHHRPILSVTAGEILAMKNVKNQKLATCCLCIEKVQQCNQEKGCSKNDLNTPGLVEDAEPIMSLHSLLQTSKNKKYRLIGMMGQLILPSRPPLNTSTSSSSSSSITTSYGIIAFRGTKYNSVNEWKSNATTGTIGTDGPHAGVVATIQGIVNKVSDIQFKERIVIRQEDGTQLLRIQSPIDQIRQYVVRNPQISTWIITGFSRGGAIATYVASQLADTFYGGKSLEVYTFAPLPLGDSKWNQQYRKKVPIHEDYYTPTDWTERFHTFPGFTRKRVHSVSARKTPRLNTHDLTLYKDFAFIMDEMEKILDRLEEHFQGTEVEDSENEIRENLRNSIMRLDDPDVVPIEYRLSVLEAIVNEYFEGDEDTGGGEGTGGAVRRVLPFTPYYNLLNRLLTSPHDAKTVIDCILKQVERQHKQQQQIKQHRKQLILQARQLFDKRAIETNK